MTPTLGADGRSRRRCSARTAWREPELLLWRSSAAIVAVTVILGVLQGVLWSVIAPGEQFVVYPTGSIRLLPTESYHQFTSIAIFVLIGVVVALAVATAVWQWRSIRGLPRCWWWPAPRSGCAGGLRGRRRAGHWRRPGRRRRHSRPGSLVTAAPIARHHRWCCWPSPPSPSPSTRSWLPGAVGPIVAISHGGRNAANGSVTRNSRIGEPVHRGRPATHRIARRRWSRWARACRGASGSAADWSDPHHGPGRWRRPAAARRW